MIQPCRQRRPDALSTIVSAAAASAGRNRGAVRPALTRFCAALLLSAAGAGSAAAQNMLIASPETIAGILRQFGSVEIAQTETGRPQLDADVDGLYYGAILYGCGADGTACESIDLYAYFSNVPLSAAAYNRWNDEFRYGTAIASAEDEALLAMSHHIAGGVTVENLVDAFSQYRTALNRFNDWAYSGGANPPFPDPRGDTPGVPPK